VHGRKSFEDHPEYVDEFGFVGPKAATDGQRIPPGHDFVPKPGVGERFPDAVLKSAAGRSFDLHRDRGRAKAAVVFFRSAVW
jgi:hypothetical protein